LQEVVLLLAPGSRLGSEVPVTVGYCAAGVLPPVLPALVVPVLAVVLLPLAPVSGVAVLLPPLAGPGGVTAWASRTPWNFTSAF
jgi:hypothetical protein